MLLNKDRAYAIMDREGLDGLIATSPINVYYLSEYWGALMRMRRTFYNYAFLPRDESGAARADRHRGRACPFLPQA
ncbi:MAG: aminopeptidase P family N-terminal domain-containing protein [Sphingobium sp.]|nr:aminopeptidase P family N-terminal domain-containing protein [Sphingobium sp.]